MLRTNPTTRVVRRRVAVSGLSNHLHNPTPLPDEKDGPSGLSRAPSGQQLEPDDNKHLTYAGYSGYRRVCRVLCKHGSYQQELECTPPSSLVLCALLILPGWRRECPSGRLTSEKTLHKKFAED